MSPLWVIFLTAALGPTKILSKPEILSEAGRRRLAENVEILKANKVDLSEALQTTKKNLEVVNKELEDLDGLEKEHIGLAEQYKLYFDQATSEAKKNKAAIKKLKSWKEQDHRKLSSDDKQLEAMSSKLAIVEQELADRKQWQTAARSKLDKLSELHRELEKNLRDIRSRRAPLRAQVKLLQKRITEFEITLRETGVRLASVEQQLKVQQDLSGE